METETNIDGSTVAAVVVDRPGVVPAVRRIASPRPGAGEALVELSAAALNPVDLALAQGGYLPGAEPDFPLVPGQEGVGRVLEGTVLKPGTRVWFFTGRLFGPGSFSERVVVPEANTIVVPDGVSDQTAASLGVAALSGWLAVAWRGQFQAGETLLVLGATGSLGAIAVQAGLHFGAGRVVAAGRDARALSWLRGLGAEIVDLSMQRSRAELADAFVAATDGGAALTIDPLWGEVGGAGVDAAPFGGRIVQLGQSSGPSCEVASIIVRGRMLSLLGFTIWAVPHEVKTEAFMAMVTEAEAGRLHVNHQVIPLAHIGEAWERQARSAHTKFILVP